MKSKNLLTRCLIGILFGIAGWGLLFFSGVLTYFFSDKSPDNSATPTRVSFKSPDNSSTPTKVSFSAIGDILLHSTVIRDSYRSGKYNFHHLFSEVKDYMKSDITFANMESIMGGKELGVAGYPVFNSPFEIGDALKEVGINIVSMANNHAMDKGEKGVLNAVNYWNKIGIEYVGASQNKEDSSRLRIINKNNIKIAFLAYTYGTNGIRVPRGKDYLVNLIDRSKISSDINKAKSQADVVVVSLHFGDEYQTSPNLFQKDLAQFVVNEGANIVLGSHPHVLQPVQWLKNKKGERALVAYSLGNFVAAQELHRTDTYIGGVLKLDIIKGSSDEGDKITLENPAFVPTYMSHHNWSAYKIIPLFKAKLADGMSNLRAWSNIIIKRMSQRMSELRVVMS